MNNILDTIREVFTIIVNFVRDVFSLNKKEEEDPLISKLESKGYTYDIEKEWWVRTWTTNTGTPIQESCLEVYQKKDDEWKVLMIGNGGDLFYEEPVRLGE
jgi:hypothetical protein